MKLIEEGGVVRQETRLFNADTGETKVMRSKEDAMDYRYFPDPDLPPLVIEDGFVDDIRKSLPELPDEKKNRYISQYGIKPYDADVLVQDYDNAKYFEDAMKYCSNFVLLSNWVTVELFAKLNKHNLDIAHSPVSPAHMAELVSIIDDDTISGKIAKTVFDEMFVSHKSPSLIVEEKDLKQIVDIKVIAEVVGQVIADNQDKVQEYKSGKDRLFGFFVGQVMKLSGGKLNPSAVNQVLKDRLSE